MNNLPKHKYLLTYRYSEIIHDGVVDFCKMFFDPFKDRRTIEQATQAARSGKQNIVEGVSVGSTSLKSEIKLLNVANGSLEEAILDFEDFLRQRKLVIWVKTDPRISEFRKYAYRLSNISNLSNLGSLKEKLVLPKNPETAANLLLTLCHLATYLLHKQIEAAERKFVEKGGYTENLFKKRISYLRNLGDLSK